MDDDEKRDVYLSFDGIDLSAWAETKPGLPQATKDWRSEWRGREDHRMDALRYKTGGISELELTVTYDTDPFPELSVLGMVGVNLNLWSRLKVAWRILRGKSRFVFWEVDDG